MRRGRDIIGKPIVTLDGGLQVATVRDLVFDHEAGQLLALLVDEGGWFRAARVVPFEWVRSIGDDAVVIQNRENIVAANTQGRIPDILNDRATLIGTALMTTDGKNLGRLADMYFDEFTGDVIGYDVTGGLFADLSSGRSFVPGGGGLSLGQDVAFVPPETALAMQEAEPGGLRGALETAGGNLQETYATLAENARESVANASDVIRDRQKAFVIGRSAGTDVRLPGGRVLVHAGEFVTPDLAERAEEHGVLGSLFTAAGGGALQDSLDAARERARIGYEDLTAASEQRQREFVLGKTAALDVTAPDGTVIVTKGDTIMPEMADLAEQRGALPRLTAAAGGGLVQSGLDATRERIGDAATQLSDTAREQQKSMLVGRTVAREVIADNGTLIVAAGATITPLDAERAERYGALDDLTSAVAGGVLQSVANRVQPTSGGTQEQPNELAPDTATSATSAIGRRVLRDVHGERGQLVAAQGQIVTSDVVSAARTQGREQELLDATVSARAVSNADDRLSSGARSVRAGAHSLLDRVRETFQELRSNAEGATLERRIHAALGRPTTRVILDPDDRVILNVGEIITHRAISTARETGVLDILLDSVSMETHPLAPDDVKPPGSGSAALPVDGRNDPRARERSSGRLDS